MSDIYFELQEQLSPVLRSGDVARCERAVAERMTALPPSPFHIVLELSITNNPVTVAGHFDGFVLQETARFNVGAVYTEMNGFSINPGRWFFDVFAFTEYGGHDDYDWLSIGQSEWYPAMTITGLETLQDVYASDAFRDDRHEDASNLADLMVILKFQDLIRRAAPLMRQLRCPLLATAHDSDFIFEVRPET